MRSIPFPERTIPMRSKKQDAIISKYRPRVRQSGTSLSSDSIEGLGRLTEKQMGQVVHEHELPDCVGNPGIPCAENRQPTLIKGYDDKMRCNPCNRVHIELVYKESGNSSPNAPSKMVSTKLNNKALAKEKEVRKRILESCKPVGGWTVPPTIRAQPGDVLDLNGRVLGEDGRIIEPGEAKKMTEDERRKKILAKYGQRRS